VQINIEIELSDGMINMLLLPLLYILLDRHKYNLSMNIMSISISIIV
jgi:hypothetical protein